MKKLLFLLGFSVFLFSSCAEGDAEIDKTAQDIKRILEEVGGKTDRVIDKVDEKLENKEETIATFKDLIDDLAQKAKEVNKTIKEDTAFLDKLKNASKDLEKTIKDIEEVLKEEEVEKSVDL